MSLLESITNVLSRKAMSDEEIIDRAAIRSARGNEPRTDAEVHAIADALQRLGKDAGYLQDKIEILRRHGEAAAKERDYEAKSAEAQKLQEAYDSIQAELGPITKRLREAGDKLAPALQQLKFDASIVGQAASIREQHPELFPD